MHPSQFQLCFLIVLHWGHTFYLFKYLAISPQNISLVSEIKFSALCFDIYAVGTVLCSFISSLYYSSQTFLRNRSPGQQQQQQTTTTTTTFEKVSRCFLNSIQGLEFKEIFQEHSECFIFCTIYFGCMWISIFFAEFLFLVCFQCVFHAIFLLLIVSFLTLKNLLSFYTMTISVLLHRHFSQYK